ncbi:MAG: hypothetical protein LBT05_02610 [Planctomycetaceae bacterium]|nr:hypothetical protein [Planctomycetaceae bacterium]
MSELCLLMREMLVAQDKQNELLEELIEQNVAAQRQRVNELAMWKKANPELAKFCKTAADRLGKIQTEYLNVITDEIYDNFDNMRDSEFMLNDFVDRFGPRFVHLNGILQVLAQLGNAPDIIPAQPKAK